jgi:hypothetical protein
LKFHVVENTAQMLLGAASLRTGAVNQQTGEKLTLGCLIKIEINPQANAFQVTVRTVLPAATSAMLQTAQTLLAEL